MNTSATLEQVIRDSELRYVNFFNGRLLSGEDLSDERDATRANARLLGQAVGSGIAFGLEVSRVQSSPLTDVQLEVKKGLAVNKAGQTLRLVDDQTLSLVRQPDPATRADCVFWDCDLVVGTTLSGDGGYYLLTIAPACKREELAPVSGLGNSPATCNSRYLTEGVRFRLLPMSVTKPSDDGHARNEIAYQCFSLTTKGLNDVATDALSDKSSTSYALEDLVPSNRLTDCDVPLAIIEWKSESGLGFIDMWSVRRRIVSLSPGGGFFEVTADRSTAEAQAMILQFQDQVGDIVANETNLTSIKATDRFRFLPPVGIIPIVLPPVGITPVGHVGSSTGFDPIGFFQGLTCLKPLFIEGAKVRALIHDALSFPPIDLSSKELIWQYLVRDNFQAFDNAKANPPRPYVILANGQISFRAKARYDLSHWSYSNYS